ncbi:hypothetical protein ACFLUB_01730 [Chloroflexota bacterium]
MVKSKVVSKLRAKRGRYGRSKVKVFSVFRSNPGEWLSTRFLCVCTGIPYHSLGRHLPRWHDFGYVVRQPCTGLGDYEYAARDKAYDWLSLSSQNLPNHKAFISELVAWQTAIKAEFDKLLVMPFTKFLPAYAKAIKAFERSQIKAAKTDVK